MAKRKPKVKRSDVARAIAATGSAERKEALWALYWDKEESLSTVARVAGTSPEAVRTMFERMGKTLRPATFREPKFYRVKAQRLREEAQRFDSIADALSRGEIPESPPPRK